MPSLIVKAATATGVAQANALFLGGGNNVLKDVSGVGKFGTVLESIEVTEAGPGGVSSMDFTIDDPAKELSLAEGIEVWFWNITANVPRFHGYVDHWSIEPDFGIGRRILVSCTGVEAWLDWLVFYPTTSIVGNTPLHDNLIAVMTGLGGPIGAILAPAASNGTQGAGVSNNLAAPSLPAPRVIAGSLDAGATLRETIRKLISLGDPSSVPGVYPPIDVMVTVDWLRSLRAWANYDYNTTPPTLLQPDDYTTLTVTDTPAGAFVAEGLSYAVEPGDALHEVYVAGGNAAGTGLFGDGTGIRGRQGVLTDSAILTAADARTRALNFLGAAVALVRGSFTLSDFTPPTTVHAGSLLALTDAQTGATATYRLFEIKKTFLASGRETWVVAFGGAPPSVSRLIRKLTRGVAA